MATSDVGRTMVTVSADEYDEYKRAYEKQHEKYGRMTDDEIDNIIDMRAEEERQKWLRDVMVNRLDTEIERIRRLQEKAQLDLNDSMQRTVKLREAALTEIVRTPTGICERTVGGEDDDE